MFKIALLVSLFGAVAHASDYCFYQPQYEQEKITVITKQLSFVQQQPKKDVAVEKIVNDQLNMVMSAIPINQAPQIARQFQFANNWPVVQPSQAKKQSSLSQSAQLSQNAQQVVSTKVLVGVIHQQIIIKDHR